MPQPWAQTFVPAPGMEAAFSSLGCDARASVTHLVDTEGGREWPGLPGAVGIGRGLCHIVLRRLW